VMGSIKIASRGGQNHKPSKTEIEEIYTQALVNQVLSGESEN
jgi:adenosine kinase